MRWFDSRNSAGFANVDGGVLQQEVGFSQNELRSMDSPDHAMEGRPFRARRSQQAYMQRGPSEVTNETAFQLKAGSAAFSAIPRPRSDRLSQRVLGRSFPSRASTQYIPAIPWIQQLSVRPDTASVIGVRLPEGNRHALPKCPKAFGSPASVHLGSAEISPLYSSRMSGIFYILKRVASATDV